MARVTGTTVSVLPVCVHLEIIRGTDVGFIFTLTDEDGVAQDITNDTVKFTAMDKADVRQIELTNGVGQHYSPSEGRTQFDIVASETDTVVKSADVIWTYEVRRIYASGDEKVWFQGEFRISPTPDYQ
jgi:hypothetical protein